MKPHPVRGARKPARTGVRMPPTHKYTFEIWPPNPDGASYPLRLPDHVSVTAQNLDEARKLAALDVPDGWIMGYTGHVRSRCEPPHPGIQ